MGIDEEDQITNILYRNKKRGSSDKLDTVLEQKLEKKVVADKVSRPMSGVMKGKGRSLKGLKSYKKQWDDSYNSPNVVTAWNQIQGTKRNGFNPM